MVDVNPEIFNNPTLGAAANGTFLDVEEAQYVENRAAKVEGREPRIATREESYPGFVPQEVTSLYDNVSFKERLESEFPLTPAKLPIGPEASSGVLRPGTPVAAPTARNEVEALQTLVRPRVEPTGQVVESPREMGDLL